MLRPYYWIIFRQKYRITVLNIDVLLILHVKCCLIIITLFAWICFNLPVVNAATRNEQRTTSAPESNKLHKKVHKSIWELFMVEDAVDENQAEDITWNKNHLQKIKRKNFTNFHITIIHTAVFQGHAYTILHILGSYIVLQGA